MGRLLLAITIVLLLGAAGCATPTASNETTWTLSVGRPYRQPTDWMEWSGVPHQDRHPDLARLLDEAVTDANHVVGMRVTPEQGNATMATLYDAWRIQKHTEPPSHPLVRHEGIIFMVGLGAISKA